ncbi:twitching motility protein PilT [Bryobacterales bacterium F-183]|nr:twitching motility protein PilT [Bryobacterales bacterium F-183]
MNDFVLDCSVAASWCFPDEQTAYTNGALRSLRSGQHRVVAPTLVVFEVTNSVLTGVRKKRITSTHATAFLQAFSKLPLVLDDTCVVTDLFGISERYGLTAYDAAYLEVALRLKLPIATLDRRLSNAAFDAGLRVYQPVL